MKGWKMFYDEGEGPEQVFKVFVQSPKGMNSYTKYFWTEKATRRFVREMESIGAYVSVRVAKTVWEESPSFPTEGRYAAVHHEWPAAG